MPGPWAPRDRARTGARGSDLHGTSIPVIFLLLENNKTGGNGASSTPCSKGKCVPSAFLKRSGSRRQEKDLSFSFYGSHRVRFFSLRGRHVLGTASFLRVCQTSPPVSREEGDSRRSLSLVLRAVLGVGNDGQCGSRKGVFEQPCGDPRRSNKVERRQSAYSRHSRSTGNRTELVEGPLDGCDSPCSQWEGRVPL